MKSLGTLDCDASNNETLQYDHSLHQIELIIDIMWIVEILMNFVKKTTARKTLVSIGTAYIKGFFIIDVVSTVPGLLSNESIGMYWFKIFRMAHSFRLTEPLTLLLGVLL